MAKKTKKLGFQFWPVPQQIAARRDLTANAKQICGYVVAKSQKLGYCFAKVETIAEKVGCSESTAHRAIARLQSLNLIDVSERFWKSGRQRSNKYVLNLVEDAQPHGFSRQSNQQSKNEAVRQIKIAQEAAKKAMAGLEESSAMAEIMRAISKARQEITSKSPSEPIPVRLTED